ncbi:MAG TPA: hypothetical protein VNW49_01770 [Puia sp.]|nr:hypothetical protein [Puia sp.]
MTEAVHEFRIKRTPLSASRLLTIDPIYLELEGPLYDARFTKEDIEGFRFGVTRFTYKFIPVSRTYNIEIKNSEGKIILIRMHSFFEIGYKKVERLFIQIHKQIQLAYFNDMAIHYARLLKGGLTYELAGAFLTNEGVLLRKEKQVIPWIRVGLASYYHSCSVYDLADPQHFRSFDYWYEWNASLLRTVIDYKIRNGNS